MLVFSTLRVSSEYIFLFNPEPDPPTSLDKRHMSITRTESQTPEEPRSVPSRASVTLCPFCGDRGVSVAIGRHSITKPQRGAIILLMLSFNLVDSTPRTTLSLAAAYHLIPSTTQPTIGTRASFFHRHSQSFL
jgi:hypothetical protein